MSYEVLCGQCGARFTMPDDLYERKVKGRAVTVRCKKCKADIPIDGVELGSRPKQEHSADTAPLSSSAIVGVLWVVSFGEEDDRELTAAQIKQALERGEVDGETLVWNTSMDEWKSIRDVPELAALAPAAGGFLGTGSQVESKVREPALRHTSRPPPAPGKEESELLGDDEIGPFRSVSAGTLQDGTLPEIDETPTVPLTRPADAVAPPKPPKRLPTAPKVRPGWMSEQPQPPKPEQPKTPPPAPAQEEEEEEAPVSGTPDLRTLLTALKSGEEAAGKAEPAKVSEDIFAIGGGGIAAQLPGIDLANLPPPSSSRDARPEEEEAPISIEPESLHELPKKAKPKPPSAKARDDEEARPSRRAKPSREATPSKEGRPSKEPKPSKEARPSLARAAETEEQKRGSALPWLAAGAVALALGYWFFLRNPEASPTDAKTARTAVETAPRPELAATSTSPGPGPTATATSTQTPGPATSESKTPGKPEKPGPSAKPPTSAAPDKLEKPEKPDKPETAPSATAPEVEMGPAFDQAAASAALGSAAGAASGCHKEGDPTGVARVLVTFAPSGKATTAVVQGPLAGTATGSCVANAMRSAKVPAFSGKPTTVAKSVSIQ